MHFRRRTRGRTRRGSSGLFRDLGNLLDNAYDTDVEFKVGGGMGPGSAQTFHAHRIILRCRSAYFGKLFSDEWGGGEGEMKKKLVLDKPHVSPEVFSQVLRFMYTGQLALKMADFGTDDEDYSMVDEYVVRKSVTVAGTEDQKKQDAANAKLLLGIMKVADEMLVNDLTIVAQEELLAHYTDYVRERALRLLILAETHKFALLHDFCVRTIRTDPYPYFFCETAADLDSSLMKELLASDDLRMKESDIWDALVVWAAHRCGLNPADAANAESAWTLDELEEMRSTLASVLPHIRLFQISRADFEQRAGHVGLLPQEIQIELFKYHALCDYVPSPPEPYQFLPPRATPNFDSLIITEKHRLLIDSWILGHDEATYLFTYSESPSPLIPMGYDMRSALESQVEAAGMPSSLPSENGGLVLSPVELPKLKKFNWELIFRASEHGRDAKSFHRYCDNQGATVTLIRTEKTGEIIGGYNPDSWLSTPGGRFTRAQQSFLFSFCSRTTNPKPQPYNPGKTNQEADGVSETSAEAASATPLEEPLVTKIDNSDSSNGPQRPASLERELHRLNISDQRTWSPSIKVSSMEAEDKEEARPPKRRVEPESEWDSPGRLWQASASLLGQSLPNSPQRMNAAPSHEFPTVIGPAPDYPTLHRLKPLHDMYAIFNSATCGPVFGGGHDLYIGAYFDRGETSCFSRSYTYTGVLRTGEDDFSVDELEVWKVTSTENS
ncbi:uncharacterized protein VTP21DRAFT_4451 [Calcarisporiella thermophila]|uniref:uncharacterized protein n=1 Tax=Calcarisporiella thermophila TaxID=911321 RepID=UPI003742E778